MIKQTQEQWLDSNYVASSKEKGLGFPDFGKVANAFMASGGVVPLKKAATGGWITGPQTGYPVSLDGAYLCILGANHDNWRQPEHAKQPTKPLFFAGLREER